MPLNLLYLYIIYIYIFNFNPAHVKLIYTINKTRCLFLNEIQQRTPISQDKHSDTMKINQGTFYHYGSEICNFKNNWNENKK